MITALFQRNIFHENDDIHYNVLKKYFNVHEINPDHLTEYDSEGQFFIYRSSIAVAKRNKIFEKNLLLALSSQARIIARNRFFSNYP